MAEELRCYRHPDRPTLLCCNRCGKPICPECAVRTPTGYRCKDCIREQQKVFDTSKGSDYPIAAVIAFLLACAGGYAEQLLGFLPSWLVSVLAGALVGGLIPAVVRKAVKGRRSPKLDLTVMIAAAAGALLPRILLVRNLSIYLIPLPALLYMLIYPIVLVLTIRTEQNGMIFRR